MGRSRLRGHAPAAGEVGGTGRTAEVIQVELFGGACVAKCKLYWNKAQESRPNKPRSGGGEVSPVRKRRVKGGMKLSRVAARPLLHIEPPRAHLWPLHHIHPIRISRFDLVLLEGCLDAVPQLAADGELRSRFGLHQH